MAQMNIEPLPPPLRSYIRTGVSITSVTQCVEELVLNSVDAGASCIAVRINLGCFKVQVVDNGDGIPNDQLEKLGNRYCTSKCHSLKDIDNLCHYGYRGEALASIVECCGTFEVVTRSKVNGKTFIKSFKNGKLVKISQASNIRPSVGTTMTVQQLFQNFPVRQKSMNQNHELNRLRETLEGIALVKPGISFSLRNDQTGQVILSSKKCLSINRTFSQLFGTTKGDSLVEVNGSNENFQVHGYISREGHQRKHLQFVYVNGRLVKKSKVHKLLKKLLLNLPALKPKLRPLATSPRLSPSTKPFFSPPPKFSEAFPVYVIEIKCPIHEYDITFDPAKTMVEFKDWDTLLSCVSDVVEAFLKNENACIQDCLSSVTKTSSLSSEDKKHKDVPVISADNLKDVLVSKLAKRVSEKTEVKPCETTKDIDSNIEDMERNATSAVTNMKTPENSHTVYCRAAVGLGKRGFDLMEDSSKSDLDNTNTSLESEDGGNTDVNNDKNNEDIMSVNASANFTSTLYLSSLSHYKKSIGKSASTTKYVSVDESLHKLNKLLPSTRNICSNNYFSSLQKFRSKFAGNSLFNSNVSKTGRSECGREENSVHYNVTNVADMSERSGGKLNFKESTKLVSFDDHIHEISDSEEDVDIAYHHDVKPSSKKHLVNEIGTILPSDFTNLIPEKPLPIASSISYPALTTEPNVAYKTPVKVGDHLEENFLDIIEHNTNNENVAIPLTQCDKSHEEGMIPDHDKLFKTCEENKVIELNSVLGKRSIIVSNNSEVVNKKQCLYFARPYNSNLDDNTKTLSNDSNENYTQSNECIIDNCDRQLNIMNVQYANYRDKSNCDEYKIESDLKSDEVVVESNSIEKSNTVNCVEETCPLGISTDSVEANEFDLDKNNSNSKNETVNDVQPLTPSIGENIHVEKDINSDFGTNNEPDLENVQETQAFTPQIEEEVLSVEKHISTPGSLGFSPIVQTTETFDSPCSTGFEYVDMTDKVETKSPSDSSSAERSGFKIVGDEELNIDVSVDNQLADDSLVSFDKLPGHVECINQNDDFVKSVEHSATSVFDLKCDSVSITQLLRTPTQETGNLEVDVSQKDSEIKTSVTGMSDDVYSRELFSVNDDHCTEQVTDDISKKIPATNDVSESCITDTYDDDGDFDNDQSKDHDDAKQCDECSMNNELSDCSWEDLSLVTAGQITKREEPSDKLNENMNENHPNNEQPTVHDAVVSTLMNDADEHNDTLTENIETHLNDEQPTVHDAVGSTLMNDADETFNAPEIVETCPAADKSLDCRKTDSGLTTDKPSVSSDLELWFKNLDVITDKVCTSNVLHLDQPSNLVKKLHACRFSKQSLKSVKVLGQVDKKFIACLIDTESSLYSDTENKRMFILIDQHAAHERIRLEILTEEAFEDGSRGGKLTSYIVDEPQCLSFTEDEVRLILEFKQNYLKLGIDFDRKSSTSLLIKTIPECLVYKEKNRIYWSTIQVLMREYLSVFMSTSAVHGVLPQTIHKVLCSLACHGAIKFGDRLTTEECIKLINDLSLCDLPFQCAHGRPSVMPLFDMKKLENISSTKGMQKPNLQKLKNKIKSST